MKIILGLIISIFSTFFTATAQITKSKPVVFLEFNGLQVGGTILLGWKTDAEINNDYFVVLKYDFDSLKFFPIDTVQGVGFSSTMSNYNYTDKGPFTYAGYYRYTLKQVDFDGSFEYLLDTIQILFSATGINELKEGNNLIIYPNPIRDYGVIKFSNPNKNRFNLSLYSISGKRVLTIIESENDQIILKKGKLTSGLYFIELTDLNTRLKLNRKVLFE